MLTSNFLTVQSFLRFRWSRIYYVLDNKNISNIYVKCTISFQNIGTFQGFEVVNSGSFMNIKMKKITNISSLKYLPLLKLCHIMKVKNSIYILNIKYLFWYGLTIYRLFYANIWYK